MKHFFIVSTFLFIFQYNVLGLSSESELLQICNQEPENIAAWTNLGIYYLKNNDAKKALAAHSKAFSLNEQDINTWFHIANCFLTNDNPERAIEIYNAILKVSFHQAAVWHNLGYAYKKMSDPISAKQAFQYALRYNLNDAGNHLSYALIELVLGNYLAGFKEYEWRWVNALVPNTFDTIPLWNGSNLSGKTLLVTAEQGFGDTFQFIRYLKLLHEKNVTIIFRAQPKLVTLLQHCPYIDTLLSKGEPYTGTADAHISLLSLPYVLESTLETIPTYTTYVYSDPYIDQYWESTLSHDTDFKIGFCFQSNEFFAIANFEKTLTKKSVPYHIYSSVFDMQNTSWYCLSLMNDDLKKNLSLHTNVHIFDDIDNAHGAFVDSASIIKQMDLIITVDTSIAHLAGALGAQTIVLLPFVADWRWLINRTDSPWYQSVYLLKQTALNDWNTIINPLQQKIQELQCAI